MGSDVLVCHTCWNEPMEIFRLVGVAEVAGELSASAVAGTL